jgi:hypothetical protein
VNKRLACSMNVCPVETSTKRSSLQRGQSLQPNPDPVSRTKAPVKTMTHNEPNAAPVTIRKVFSDTRATP